MNTENSYAQYVHEFVSPKTGETLYAVGVWQKTQGQFYRPLSKEVAKLSGCTGEFSKTLAGFGGYTTRSRALQVARRLFAPDPYDE